MTVDGLGFEEVNQTVTSTAVISGTNVYGTTSVESATLSGTNVYAATKVQSDTVQSDVTISGVNARVANDLTIGSSVNLPYTLDEGMVINNIAAEAIITGGMWVEISGASGTTPSFVAKGTEEPMPVGICLATVASGANASILTRGPYHGIVAEATLSTGDGFAVGAGNALNCAKATGAGVNRGIVTMGAGSEGVCAVYLY